MFERLKQFWEEHWVFICILVLAIGLRVVYATPGIRYPGTDISLQAYNLLHERYDINLLWSHLGVRYAMLLLVAGVYAIFGVSEISAMIIPFLASVGNIILIYYFGRILFSKEAGLLAAFFLAVLPLDVFNATILETDGTMTFFAVLAMSFYYCLITDEKNGVNDGDHRKNVWPLIFVGIIIALSALTKIFGVLLLFSIGLYEILTFEYQSLELKKQLKTAFFRFLAILCGFALIYAPVLIWQYIETGDFLYNIHVEKNVMYSIRQFEYWPEPNYDFVPKENDYWTYLKFMFNPVKYSGSFSDSLTDDGTNPMLNIFFYFIVAAVFYFILKKDKRDKKTTFLLCWFLAAFLFLENYYFIIKVQRYLMIAIVPGLLLAAYFLCSIMPSSQQDRSTRIGYGYCILFCLFFIALFLISIYQLGAYTVFNPYFQKTINNNTISLLNMEEYIFHTLNQHSEKDVYITNYQIIPLLNFYFQYTKNYSGPHGYTGPTSTSFYDLHFVTNLSSINDAYIIIEYNYFQNDTDIYNYYLYNNVSLLHNLTQQQVLLTSIPSDWKFLAGIINENMEVSAVVFES